MPYVTTVSQASTGKSSWDYLNAFKSTVGSTTADWPGWDEFKTGPTKLYTETVTGKHTAYSSIPATATPTGVTVSVKIARVLGVKLGTGNVSLLIGPEGGAYRSGTVSSSTESTFSYSGDLSYWSLTTSEWWDLADGIKGVRFYCWYAPWTDDVVQMRGRGLTLSLSYTLPESQGIILTQPF